MRMYIQAIAGAIHDCDDDTDLTVFENPKAHMFQWRSLRRMRSFSCPLVPSHRVGRVAYQNSIYPLLMRAARIDALLATCNVIPIGTPVPTVLVIQSLQFFDHPEGFGSLQKRYLKAALANSVKRASAVICVSQFSKRQLIQLTNVDPGKVHVVYHGLPPSHGVSDSIAGSNGSSPPYVLCIAHLQPYKNVLRAMAAYAELRRSHGIPQRLRIIGFEDQYTARDIHEYATDLRVADSVDFLGPIGHEDLRAQYSMADLLLYPSLYETFGLPPLEAMAAGCPVVASNSSAIPEVVGNAAQLVDPLDVADIARGMLHVLSDQSWRRELIGRGRLRAAEFTWDKAGRSTLQILKEVVGAEQNQHR
jgi:glycosyltransferase involved in cell wall biosynthesis